MSTQGVFVPSKDIPATPWFDIAPMSSLSLIVVEKIPEDRTRDSEAASLSHQYVSVPSVPVPLGLDDLAETLTDVLRVEVTLPEN